MDEQKLFRELERRGQGDATRWWDELSATGRDRLRADLESIPWSRLEPAIQSHVLTKPPPPEFRKIEPAKVFSQSPAPEHQSLYQRARRTGEKLLSQGKVAAFTVAGGQGTRLGVAGPKGCVAVTPVAKKSLFQLFAETVWAARKKYAADIAWYIMTNVENHEETVSYFEKHEYFELPRENVRMFPQGMLPAFDFQGRLLLAGKDHLALAPDGHGGSLKALATSGSLADMRARGVQFISYFQVDNPLVKPFDPLFIGLHVETQSELSTKVARKADDFEKVGNVCVVDGRLTVIEYTEFPQELASRKNTYGSRMFDAANLAMHLFNVEFVERVATTAPLPFRRAEKVVAFVNERGELIKPDSPNAVKLETFVFDALSLAKNPLVLEVHRGEEFSPVKNETGVDSLETSQRDQVQRACNWLEKAGVSVPRKPDGTPAATMEIGPKFAMDAEDVVTKRDRIPTIRAGESFSL